MARRKNDNKLFDDTGIHVNVRDKHITVFVALCRVMTVILIVLGTIALIYGNM